MKDILTARREAGTPCGIEYANRLEAMPPDEAADEIYDMFCLCADEDLGCEISCDLQLHPKAATQIAIAIERKRAAESTSSDDDPLDWPENYLWVRLGTGRSTMIDGNRLYELLGGAPPETPTEKLLANGSGSTSHIASASGRSRSRNTARCRHGTRGGLEPSERRMSRCPRRWPRR